MSRLDELRDRFFATVDDAGHPITTATDDVEVELIVDGRQYFAELFAVIEATGPGDQVLLLGWTFDADMRRLDADRLPFGPTMGDLLAGKQHADGVQVYVVLNGSFWNRQPLFFFAQSLAALRDLRHLRIPPGASAPPLDRQVMLDFSGAASLASHHQKVAVIRRGDDTVAYVGGIDLWPNRHDSPDHPGILKHDQDGSPWGWHDAAMRLRGRPVADVWANFVSRWEETSTLPKRSTAYRGPDDLVGSWKLLNPDPPAPAPSPPTFTAETPNPDVAVQVLRSRLPFKLYGMKSAAVAAVLSPPGVPLGIAALVGANFGRVPWEFPPLGGIRQVHATLIKAIAAARRYIYIEDQFFDDTPTGEAFLAAGEYSLREEFVNAVRDHDVKIILVTTGDGKADGPPFRWPLPYGLSYNGKLTEDLRKLSPPKESNLAIWQLTDLMVHTKLMIIDDEFCAVGSANVQSRSMYGVDQELHVAVVDAAVDGNIPAGVVRDWRVRLWAEHLEIGDNYTTVRPQLENLDLALGMWRASWRVGGTPGMWFSSGNPPGFNPAKNRRTFFGPPPMEG